MVVTVSFGIIYALYKWFCSDDEPPSHRNNYRADDEVDHNYRDNGFTSIQPHAPSAIDDDPAPQYQHIPLMPINKGPSPRHSPVPFAPYPTTTPYPSGSSSAPYPPSSNQGSALPYPTGDSAAGMPMPMPAPQ